jgi:hypothetical protein
MYKQTYADKLASINDDATYKPKVATKSTTSFGVKQTNDDDYRLYLQSLKKGK